MRPPVSGTYRFYSEQDDSFSLWLDGRAVIKNNGRGTYKLDSNKWYDVRAEFIEYSGEAKVMLFWETREFGRQIIPPRFFRTFAGPAPDGEDSEGTTSKSLATYAVKSSTGSDLRAILNSSENGSLFKIKGDISSGLYQMTVPNDHRGYFTSFLRGESNQIPFTVRIHICVIHVSIRKGS